MPVCMATAPLQSLNGTAWRLELDRCMGSPDASVPSGRLSVSFNVNPRPRELLQRLCEKSFPDTEARRALAPGRIAPGGLNCRPPRAARRAQSAASAIDIWCQSLCQQVLATPLSPSPPLRTGAHPRHTASRPPCARACLHTYPSSMADPSTPGAAAPSTSIFGGSSGSKPPAADTTSTSQHAPRSPPWPRP
jgi:hypothetical protein